MSAINKNLTDGAVWDKNFTLYVIDITIISHNFMDPFQPNGGY